MPWLTDLYHDPVLDQSPRGAFRNRPLRAITLPGTHDSGCYRDQSISNVYSATQTQDIFQQLAGGVRYFDLRPCKSGDEYWTYHGPAYWGGRLTGADGILRQIAEYLAALAPTDRELVILNVSHFFKFTDAMHQELIDAIRHELGDYLVRFTQANINIFDCPYWQLLSDAADGVPEMPPLEADPDRLRSRVLVLYDGALDTPQTAFLEVQPVLPFPGFFLLAQKYPNVPQANQISLFDQYSNSASVDGGLVAAGMRANQLHKLHSRFWYRYTDLTFRRAGYPNYDPGNWTANFVGGVAGTLHLLSWTLTPQLSLTVTGTWSPLVAARDQANPLLLDLFCGPGRGWTGASYDALHDPQINIIYVDNYASTVHRNPGSPWNGMAMPVAIAARMNVGPVGPENTW
jgi:hypothetical protein